MRKGLRVDRYTKFVLALIVVLLAALLCKPLFITKPVIATSGFGFPRLGPGVLSFPRDLEPENVYYLGLTNEEILVALEIEWSDLQKKISEMTPDEKKELTDEDLKLHAYLTETTYDELKNMGKFHQVNIILMVLYLKNYRVKFVTDAFIILEQ